MSEPSDTVNVRYMVDDVAAAVAFYTFPRGCVKTPFVTTVSELES
jgi:hypothetical protein